VLIGIVTIKGGLYAVLIGIVTIKGGLYAVLIGIVTIMTITGRFMCSVNSYCDNKGDVYMQC